MGKSQSKENIEIVSPEVALCMGKFKFKVSQIQRLRQVFVETDNDNNGYIDMQEFHDMFGENESPFLTHLFNTMDVNDDHQLSFVEFIDVVSTFALFQKSELVDFAFDAFDSDGDGVICEDEFKRMVNNMRESEEKHKIRKHSVGLDYHRAVSQALQLFDANGDNVLDRQEFAQIHRVCPRLLWPLFRLQYHMQQTTFGIEGWKTHRRLLLEGKKRSILLCCFPRRSAKVAARYGASQKEKEENYKNKASSNPSNHLGSVRDVLQKNEANTLLQLTESVDSLRGLTPDQALEVMTKPRRVSTFRSNASSRYSTGSSNSLRSTVSAQARQQNMIGLRRKSKQSRQVSRDYSRDSVRSHRTNATTKSKYKREKKHSRHTSDAATRRSRDGLSTTSSNKATKKRSNTIGGRSYVVRKNNPYRNRNGGHSRHNSWGVSNLPTVQHNTPVYFPQMNNQMLPPTTSPHAVMYNNNNNNNNNYNPNMMPFQQFHPQQLQQQQQQPPSPHQQQRYGAPGQVMTYGYSGQYIPGMIVQPNMNNMQNFNNNYSYPKKKKIVGERSRRGSVSAREVDSLAQALKQSRHAS